MFGDPQMTFGAAGVDRAAHLRGDPAGLAALGARPDATVAVLWRGQVLADGDRAAFLPGNHPLFAGLADPVFLGLDAGRAIFAHDLSGWAPEDLAGAGSAPEPGPLRHPLLPGTAGFTDLRAIMAQLPPTEAETLATARALIGWHQTHGFCACCGQSTVQVQGGWQRQCPACGAQHFPRTDPVVIMLVLRANSVLLGRSPGWPEGTYSLLAGFMEPGETMEAAVRREVAEETGVMVGRVGYLASQPWPFPASLMLGCRAEALTDAISLDPAELEDALWLRREEVAAVFAGRHATVRPPRRGAIAEALLRGWLEGRW